MRHDFLTRIIDHKKKLIATKQEWFARLKQKAGATPYTRYCLFKKRISRPGRINLIAEIKKASPSKGLIRQDFDIQAIAGIYARHQVAAISVLTEEKYFLGRPEYVRKVSDQVDVPVLTKDFIIDVGQIYEAWFYGAGAVLLIAAILSAEQMTALMREAQKLDLDCLVEVHDEQDLDQALDCEAEIIGINNRDLRSFEVDLTTTQRLRARIPQDKLVVAESGIQTRQDVQWLKELGVNAILVGETLMRAQAIGPKIQELMGEDDD